MRRAVVGTWGPRHRSTNPLLRYTVTLAFVDSLARLDTFDDLGLERLVGEELEGTLDAEALANERLTRGDDLGHPAFDLLEVFGRERTTNVEVVVETVGDRRSDGECRPG